VKIAGAVVVVALFVPALIVCVRRPARTVLPVFAALVPAGSAFPLSVPFPKPFNTLSSLLGALVIASVAGHLLLYRRGRIPGPADALWLAFLSWCGATLFWARSPGAAVQDMALAVPLIVFLVLVSGLRADRSDLDLLRVAVVLGGAGVGAYGLFLVLTGASLPVHGFGQRFSVSTSPHATNPNQLAASLLLPLVFALDIAIRGIGRTVSPLVSRTAAAVSFGLIVVGIALSGSRGGALAALIGAGMTLAFSAWWRPETRRNIVQVVGAAYLVAASLGVLTYLAVSLAPEGPIAHLVGSSPIVRLIDAQTGSSGRAEIWTTGYIACRTYCGMGAGVGNFPDVYDQTLAYSGLTKNVGLDRPGHNLYLTVAVETGVVGFTLFTLAILAEWMALRRTSDMAPALAAAVLALLIADVFEGFLWFKFFWLPFIVIRVAQGSAGGEPVWSSRSHARNEPLSPRGIPSAPVGADAGEG
jgi:O-Antigen ligase